MPIGQRSGATTGRAPRRDAVRNDRLVLEAALAVFGESGPQASMEDIAARAGVGVGTIYRRFPSKDALLDELAARIAEEMERAIAEAIDDDDPGRGLRTFLEFVGDFDVAKRRFSPVLIDRVGDQGVSEAMADMVGTLTARAIGAGALSADVRSEDILALVKALRGVITATEGDDDAWRRFLRIHLDGLRVRR
ncbi:MAG TPA: helix-turn-helix domain-containing protein [Lacisediminihabitans sp.]|uniref:TetR/AcrR family transcriptional regulator n=1 Tax=Lacisediminihabitans sp. TaxID=2787631 RepID=UPI002EDB4419